jgi:hypothetical protein
MTCTTTRKELTMDDRKEPDMPVVESASALSVAEWRKPSLDEKLDEALRQTFPASDAFAIYP